MVVEIDIVRGVVRVGIRVLVRRQVNVYLPVDRHRRSVLIKSTMVPSAVSRSEVRFNNLLGALPVV